MHLDNHILLEYRLYNILVDFSISNECVGISYVLKCYISILPLNLIIIFYFLNCFILLFSKHWYRI